ncbi:unnamed protein product [Ectocarpus sp. 8 AP-2014]
MAWVEEEAWNVVDEDGGDERQDTAQQEIGFGGSSCVSCPAPSWCCCCAVLLM